MKVILSSIVKAKLRTASTAERKAAGELFKQLRAAKHPMGKPLKGVANAYGVSSTSDGPVVLYEYAAGAANVRGFLTELQRQALAL